MGCADGRRAVRLAAGRRALFLLRRLLRLVDDRRGQGMRLLDRPARSRSGEANGRGFQDGVAPYAACPRTVATVEPISAGVGAMATPTSRRISTFSLALSPKAEMMAPAWPMRRPLGAERPAI